MRVKRYVVPHHRPVQREPEREYNRWGNPICPIERTEFRVITSYAREYGEQRVITFCHDDADVRAAYLEAQQANVGAGGVIQSICTERAKFTGNNMGLTWELMS